MKLHVIAGQPSWQFASDRVEAAITQTGGHLAPVRFRLGRRVIAPFSIAPWAEENLGTDVAPILRALRGDFFCAPFGANEMPYRGEQHSLHGEAANKRWRFESLREDAGRTTLHLSLTTKVRTGRIDKCIQLRRGETNLYCRHVLSGMTGAMTYGHHAMLKCPAREGAGLVSTSRIQFGEVAAAFELPAQGGYHSLKAGARFSRLDRVPSAAGSPADLSRYPAREGYEDIVMVVHRSRPDFAWTAVSFPEEGYVWFSLKDPRVLCSTIFWMSNGGRHYPPWNGRHRGVLGVEDVTSFFAGGLAESVAANAFSRQGVPTFVALRKSCPLAVNYIMGVAAIPAGFDRVASISPVENTIKLTAESGKKLEIPVDTGFLKDLPQ